MEQAVLGNQQMATTRDGLIQMLEQIDEKHEAGHKRLRETIMELQEQHENMLAALTLLKDHMKDNANLITTLKETPPNVERLLMSPRIVIGIVVFAVTIAGGIWSSTAGIRTETAALRSDVRDVLTRMEAQKIAGDSAREVQNLQWNQLRGDVDEIKRQQKLDKIDSQDLREKILFRTK